MRDYKELKIWQYSHELVKEIYEITSSFPEKELFCIVSQLRRASVSIPTNIAEGCGRTSKLELMKFLDYSMGSLYEVEYLVFLSFELKYINGTIYEKIKVKISELVKMISSFKKYIKQSEPNILKT